LRSQATLTILRKTENALAIISLLCGVGLLGLSGFFSSGTHRLASVIGGWAIEALAAMGFLLLCTTCTLCTGPDGGVRTHRCSGLLLALMAVALAGAVAACFFAQADVFDAMGKAISHEELEELLGDLRSLYCGGLDEGQGNGTASSWSSDLWEETGIDEPEPKPEPVWSGGNSTGNGTLVWDCEDGGEASLQARTWADLQPLVFAWLDTVARWLVLLLGLVAARAALLLKAKGRHDTDGGGGAYAALTSDQAGTM